MTMSDGMRFFRAAGYVFTWGEVAPGRAAVVEMFRESLAGDRRYFVARARCAPDRASAYARAMALVAWVRSLDVPARRDPQAQAVLEQLAVLRDRLSRLPVPLDVAAAPCANAVAAA